MKDQDFMKEAFKEAQKAYKRGECPVGALLVHDGKIIARAGNREIELKDPTAHAEILVLREASQKLEQHTFRGDYTIFTTLWPCPMCENAMLQAKITKVVCGARSFKYIYENTFNKSRLSKSGPIMEKDCRNIFIKWLKDKELYEIIESGIME
jgi:tRNA(adenine34) deaminase